MKTIKVGKKFISDMKKAKFEVKIDVSNIVKPDCFRCSDSGCPICEKSDKFNLKD